MKLPTRKIWSMQYSSCLLLLLIQQHRSSGFTITSPVAIHQHNRSKIRTTLCAARRQQNQNQTSNKKYARNNNYKGKPRNNKYMYDKDQMDKYREINTNIVNSEHAIEILQIFVQEGGLRPGITHKAFSAVNYSTALNRIAKFCTYFQSKNMKENKKSMIVKDVRFAMLLANLVDSILDSSSRHTFKNREVANLLWAVAKLKLPTQSENTLEYTSELLRNDVTDCIRNRSIEGSEYVKLEGVLTANLFDYFREEIVGCGKFSNATPQEIANLAWSYGTANRGDEALFRVLTSKTCEFLSSGSTLFQFNKDPHSFTNMEDPETMPRKELHQIKIKLLKPQEISNLVWALGTTKICIEELNEIIGFVNGLDPVSLNLFKEQEISNFLWAITTLKNHEHMQNIDTIKIDFGFFEKMVKHLTYDRAQDVQNNNFKPQEISNIMWAVTYLNDMHLSNDRNRDLLYNFMLHFCNIVYHKISKFPPQEMNNLIWSIAKIYTSFENSGIDFDKEESDDELQNAIIRVINASVREMAVRKCQNFGPQDISTIVYSLALLGYKKIPAYQVLCTSFLRNNLYYRAQECSNLLWALGTCEFGVDDEIFFKTYRTIASKLSSAPNNFKPQELKDILWAHGKGSVLDEDFFSDMAVYLTHRDRGLSDFEPQSLGGISWAYAKQISNTDDTFTSINGRQAVYNRLNHVLRGSLAHDLFLELGDESLRKLDRFSTRDMSNIMFSYSTLGLVHEPLLNGVVEQFCTRQIQSFGAGCDVAIVVWGLASLNYPPPEKLRQKFEYQIESAVQNLKFQDFELLHLTWGAVVLGVYSSVLLQRVVDVLGNKIETLETSQQSGLLYIQTLCQLDPKCNAIFDFPTLIDATTWSQGGELEDGIQSSAFQTNVHATLETLLEGADNPIQEEYVVHDFLYTDTAIPNQKLCIECDGPSHYCLPIRPETRGEAGAAADPNNIWNLRKGWVNGSTVLKERLLSLLGWKVVHVPYYEWSMMKGSSNDDSKTEEQLKREYLREIVGIQ